MFADTIFATASCVAPAERAVVRLSGPRALAAAALVFSPDLAAERGLVEGRVVAGPGLAVEAFALVMPGPRSFTGEDVVELHLPGSPLLCSLLAERLRERGAPLLVRAAQPGEFSARAFANGRIDLLQAEGILLLVHGAGSAATAAGASWLCGGLSAGVAEVRATLQDALAWLEAGLDFEPAETGAVAPSSWRDPLARAAAQLADLLASLPIRAPGGEVLLLGRSNAGKSSLANALAGHPAVVVDAGAGTTRDVVRVPFAIGDRSSAVWDAPGDLDEPGAIDRAALQLRDRLAGQATAALLVVDPHAGDATTAQLPPAGLSCLAVVFTGLDRGAPPPAVAARVLLPLPAGTPWFAVSSTTGAGIAALRAFLIERSTASSSDPGAFVRGALASAERGVERARRSPPGALEELVGADVRAALAELDAIDGTHSPEDLLDRVFGRFCLGK